MGRFHLACSPRDSQRGQQREQQHRKRQQKVTLKIAIAFATIPIKIALSLAYALTVTFPLAVQIVAFEISFSSVEDPVAIALPITIHPDGTLAGALQRQERRFAEEQKDPPSIADTVQVVQQKEVQALLAFALAYARITTKVQKEQRKEVRPPERRPGRARQPVHQRKRSGSLVQG